MPPLTSVLVDVYADVPYRPRELRDAAPQSEDAGRKVEAVWAFKNGRAMSRKYGGHRFVDLVGRLVLRCKESPLAAAAAETTWVPVPRSGVSQDSFDEDADPFPCWTLCQALAEKLGGRAVDALSRRSPLKTKHFVQPNLDSLRASKALSLSPRVVLVDDVLTTGCTLVACAAMLRERGHEGEFYSFCAGYTIDGHEADRAHPSYQAWRLSWQPGWDRPRREPLEPWAKE